MPDKQLAAAQDRHSRETDSSGSSTHRLSSSASSSESRKGRSADSETSSATSEKASISSPSVSTWSTSISQIQRRPSSNGGYISLPGSEILPSRSTAALAEAIALAPPPPRSQRISLVDSEIAQFSGPESGRHRVSATFSIDSAIMSSSWGSVPSVASSAAGSEQGDDAVSRAYTSSRASTPAVAALDATSHPIPVDDSEPLSATSQGPTSSLISSYPARTHSAPRASRSRASAARRLSGFLSGASTTSSRSPQSDRATDPDVFLGVLGICALDAKARSKPSRNILNRINAQNEFEVVMFGDKIILDEAPENWPLCDFLISFFSEGFPLHKAIEYVRLRKPFSVNDMPMQTVLWDRRACLKILDRYDVPTPRRLEVIRDGGPRAATNEIGQHIFERTGVRLLNKSDLSSSAQPPPKRVFMKDPDTLVVDGKELRKPFVEKPTNGDDHNIHIYYEGGGGRRLFRKVNNKSSEADDTLNVPRCITEEGSTYIYEKFLATDDNEDVKAYTVGSHFCHAETRRSPVVDGIVKRNTHGKEVRYVAKLDEKEQIVARKIAEAFGQRVCGFDLLRANGKSYVIDVNGWSFVKDNNAYYDKCAEILRELFVKERLRRDGPTPLMDGENAFTDLPTRRSTTHLSSLKSILKSPSMSRLGPNHSHASRSQRGDASPDLSSQMMPILSSTSTEKTLDSPLARPYVPTSVTSSGAAIPETTTPGLQIPSLPPPATKSQWRLKGMVAVIRHADRTPKQKFKYTFHTKPFVDLLKGHTEEVLLIGEVALQHVQEAVQEALKEGIEDPSKLKQLKAALDKKGGLPGTKVQIKPVFGKAKEKKKEKVGENEGTEGREENFENPIHSRADVPPAHEDRVMQDVPDSPISRKESLTGVTLSRAAAAEGNLGLEKLQLIVKWGGEPTHSARYQSQELGENFRNDLLLMNRDSLEDLKVFSSSERRVTTSARIWTAAFLNVQEVPPDHITVRKDLLNDSNAAKDEMDKVKKKLKGLLRKGNKAPEQFAWPESMPEPYIVAGNVVELMRFHRRVMQENFARLQPTGLAAASLAAAMGKASNPPSPGGPNEGSIQPRWCSGEDATLFRERWEKLFEEFTEPEKVDPGKISELHDTIKFDALHNRQFLEWVFTPSPITLEEVYPSENATKEPARSSDSSQSETMKPPPRSDTSGSQRSSVSSDKAERTSLSSRMPWRKRPSAIDTAILRSSANDPYTQSYFNLYTGDRRSRASTDERLAKLRELFLYSKVLFDFIGPQEYGITDAEKLEIGLLTSLPLLRAIVNDIEDMQASVGAKTRVYFTKESHIYTLLNCIIEGGITTKIDRKNIPELDYLSTICFELYESTNPASSPEESESFNYSIRITISPGCHTFEPLDVQLDSKHCIGFAQRRSLTAHNDYAHVIETLRARFNSVKLPKSFVAVNLSEKVPQAFGEGEDGENVGDVELSTDDERGREELRWGEE